MISGKPHKTEIRAYLSPTLGLPMARQRQIAQDANSDHVYEHRPFKPGEFSQLERWMQSLRAGDTAVLPSVLCLIYPAKDRPEGYRPLAGMCAALNRLLATGVTIVDAKGGITSEDPEAWAKHVSDMSRKVSAGARSTAARRKSMKKAAAAIMPGVVARWKAPAMAKELARQKAIWTGAGTWEDVLQHMDAELQGCGLRTLYSILGHRRPGDPGAGGRGRKRKAR